MKILSVLTIEISNQGFQTGRQFVASNTVLAAKILNQNQYEYYRVFKIFEEHVPRLHDQHLPKGTSIKGHYSLGTSEFEFFGS